MLGDDLGLELVEIADPFLDRALPAADAGRAELRLEPLRAEGLGRIGRAAHDVGDAGELIDALHQHGALLVKLAQHHGDAGDILGLERGLQPALRRQRLPVLDRDELVVAGGREPLQFLDGLVVDAAPFQARVSREMRPTISSRSSAWSRYSKYSGRGTSVCVSVTATIGSGSGKKPSSP